MSSLRIRNSVAEDVPLIAARIREADRTELWRSSHATPERAMEYGLRHSSPCLTIDAGAPIGIFGAVPSEGLEDIGICWMVCTIDIRKHAKAFLKGCRPELRLMMQRYERLFNFVDADNAEAVNWLRWLGFTIYPAHPYGIEECPFHPFEIARHV